MRLAEAVRLRGIGGLQPAPARVPQAASMSAPPEYRRTTGCCELAGELVAEPLEFLERGPQELAGVIGNLDQVEPHGRVSDQVGEGLRVGFVDVDAADADIDQHDSLAAGQRVATRGGHDLARRGCRPATGTSRARFASVAAPRLIARRNGPALAGIAVDLRHEADGADRDRTCGRPIAPNGQRSRSAAARTRS